MPLTNSCPNCGARNQSGSSLCRVCSSHLNKAMPLVATPEVDVVLCGSCGAEKRQGDAFCSKCGISNIKVGLPTRPGPTVPLMDQKRLLRRKWWVLFACSIVLGYIFSWLLWTNLLADYDYDSERQSTVLRDKIYRVELTMEGYSGQPSSELKLKQEYIGNLRNNLDRQISRNVDERQKYMEQKATPLSIIVLLIPLAIFGVWTSRARWWQPND